MREANWNETFAPRHHELLVVMPEVPREPQGWRRLLWWEDWLTFGLLSVILVAVVGSVHHAHWVDGMPSLYPVAFLGLAMGALLSRLRWHEGFVHLLALPLGAAGSLGQILTVLPGPTPWDRYDVLHERLADWFHIAFTGGISNDELPFVVLVVPSAWLAAYASSWAVFRWRNAWLALIPNGAILLTNISFQPGQFSFAFVVFLVGGTVLVTRLHLLDQAKAWRDGGTPYPPLLSLSVLHASFWAALALVGLAWLLPQANEAGALESLWRRATVPAAERFESLSRLFVAVDSKQNARVHSFDDILPFLGSIELPDTAVLDVMTGQPLDQPGYLRAQAYYVYTSGGWTEGSSRESTIAGNVAASFDEGLSEREEIALRIIASGRTGDTLFTLGQPQRVDRTARIEWGAPGDITGVESRGELRPGSRYEAVGSVSVASEAELRAAGTAYPVWVRPRYLPLPTEFSPRVRGLAYELAGSRPTPYDKALAIERYLRAIRYDLDVPDVPPGRDAIEFFLFESRRGYFDYHASAMVVMLRSVGVPARLAVGYALQEGQFDRENGRYRVTEASAFAWPEVYFPGLGWVEFNPTPNLPTVRRPGAASEPAGAAEGEGAPSDTSLDGLFGGFPQEDERDGDAIAPASSTDRTRWVLIGIAAGLAVAAASLAGGLGYAWLRGLAGLEPPARLWEQTVRLASWARLPPAPSQTPREYARTLREEVPGTDGIDLLADAYVRHQFGHERIDGPERKRLKETWRAVRGRLLRRLLRLG